MKKQERKTTFFTIGKRISGNKDVTGNGMISKIQYITRINTM